MDTRNAKFRNVTTRSRDLDDEDSSNRVEKAEKRVGEFVARRLSPAVQRVRKTPVRRWFSGVRSGAGYVGGLWGRCGLQLCGNLAVRHWCAFAGFQGQPFPLYHFKQLECRWAALTQSDASALLSSVRLSASQLLTLYLKQGVMLSMDLHVLVHVIHTACCV